MGVVRDQMETDLKLRGLQPATQTVYLRCVMSFVKYHMRSPREMGEAEIRSFVVHLVDRGLSAATRCVHVAALRFLYKVTLQRPEEVERIPFPKVPRKIPDILSRAEVERLLECIRSIAYRALIMLTYSAGLRSGEAVRLKPSDIDSQRGVIHIRLGKGQKDRLVPLSPRVLLLLREYWKVARPSSPYLFPGRKPGRHLSRQVLGSVLRKATREAGVSKHVTPHVLRHSYATHLLESGVDVLIIQRLLGHSSLRSTVRYTHANAALITRTRSPLDLTETDENDNRG